MHSLYQILLSQSNSEDDSLFNFIPFSFSGFSVSYINLKVSCSSSLNSNCKGNTEDILVPISDIVYISLFVDSSILKLYKI